MDRSDPVFEHTHLGPELDAGVARARRQMRPPGRNPDYDLLRDNFDVAGFLLQAPGLMGRPDVDPVGLFLRNGAQATLQPTVNFSMTAYLERHPERAENAGVHPYVHWLREGRAAGELADPGPGLEKMASVLDLRVQELAEQLAETRTDVTERLRTGKLGEMLARAAELDPLIGAVWTATVQPKLATLASAKLVDQVAALDRCQRALGLRRARLLLLVKRPRWGGGRRIEGHLSHALSAGHLDPEDIVVIYTDESGEAPVGRYPVGVRELDLAREVAGMEDDDAQRLLVELVRSLHADAVVNINSRLLYRALIPYGRALAVSERIFLFFFCIDQSVHGNWTGFPLRYFHRLFEQVEGVITDSHYFAEWLRTTYLVTPEHADRIHVFSAPVDPTMPVASAGHGRRPDRPQVYWAGRWDRQKRIDVVLEIARRMPDVDFQMWGEAWLDASDVSDIPANVHLHAAYAHITDLDLSAAGAWLYTSAWDGVPSQLLEVSMTGVPIVGSLVGGTGELLLREGSWPVADVEDADAYVSALREVLAEPELSRRRALALRQRLLEQRTVGEFTAVAERVLLAQSGTEGRG